MMRVASVFSKLKRPLAGLALLILAGCAGEQTESLQGKASEETVVSQGRGKINSNPVIPSYLTRYPASESSVPIRGVGATPSCAELDNDGDVKTSSLPMSWGRYVMQASGSYVTEYWQGIPQNQLLARITICVENVKVSYLLLSDLPLLDDNGLEFVYSSTRTTDKYRTGLYYYDLRGTFFKQIPIFEKLGIDKFISWPDACRGVKFCDVTDAMDTLTTRQWRKWSRGGHHHFKMEPPDFIGRVNYSSPSGLQTLLYTGALQTKSYAPYQLTGQTPDGLRFVVILPENYSESVIEPDKFIEQVMRNFSSIISKESM